jgi:YD repeat-containing protein
VEVDGLGRRTTTAYDAAGRRSTRQDARGHVTTYTHDAIGLLTK